MTIEEAPDATPAKVFVSYSHDSEGHRQRVLAWADRLRREGVDVELDQYVAHPAEGWPQWTRRQLVGSDFVLFVCTPTYRRRFEGEETSGGGKGVAWEAMHVDQALYDDRGISERLIPILLEEGVDDDIPLSLRKFTRYRLPEEYEELYRRLTTQPRVPRPPLGEQRPRPPEAREPPPDFEAYRRATVERYRTLRLAGFNERVRVRIDLDGLYVELDVVLDHGRADRMVFNDGEHARNELSPDASCQRIPLAKAFELARTHGKKRGLALLGDPGSGKTTELQRVLLSVLSDDPGRGTAALGLPPGALPVFLPLRNLRREESLESFMQHELGEGLGPELAQRLLRRGNLLLLLDGLDEVADQGQRKRVARWIEKLCKDYPDFHFVVSSRFAGYVPDVRLDDHFLELHLRSLTPVQVRGFVHNWYKTVEAAEAELERRMAAIAGGEAKPSMVGDDEVGMVELLADFRVPEGDHVEATHLLARFDEPGFSDAQVYALTTNPLLLTAICLVHRRHGGKLPESRRALLHECTSVLLEGWRHHKALPVELRTQKARRVLQPVALWMHGEHGRTQASARELEPPVRVGLARVTVEGTTPEVFLQRIRDESGLLTGWGVDRYGFMHLAFQEYLAALELCEAAPRWWQRDPLRRLAKQFGESWWQEVILLMLAQEPERFGRLMGYVTQRPELVKWARSAMMSRVLAQPSEAVARPLVELVEVGARGQRPLRWAIAWLQRMLGSGLEARQLAAVELLGRRMPKVVEGLDERLARHPSAKVRAWWERWQRRSGREVESVFAKRGGVELVLVPGGRFMMGSPQTEEGRFDSEGPQHEVELASFYLARTPVTNAQYREYLKENPKVSKPEYWGDRRYNQDEQPVVGVSWHDAQAYCTWAGLLLPTEAQWEYACRAGTTTRYWSGDSEEDLARVGWYGGNSEGRLHAVGEKDPNAFGLYDMHGNLYEWCLDNFGDYDARPRTGDGLRHEPVGGGSRVIRGGYFVSVARLARSAYRGWFGPGYRGVGVGVGFRAAQGHPWPS